MAFGGTVQFSDEILGAIHWTKISGNSGTESNGTEIFEKIVSKISVNLWSFCFIWHSISNFVQTLGPIPIRDCRVKMAESSLNRYQCSICFFFGWFAVLLTAFVRGWQWEYCTARCPSVSRKQSRTNCTSRLNPFPLILIFSLLSAFSKSLPSQTVFRFPSLRSSSSSKWKMQFHSVHGHFGNANRKF